MKKEIVITAVVFLSVGFLSGYIFQAQRSWKAQQQVASASAQDHDHDHDHEPAGSLAALPEGHPPVDTGTILKTLEEAAAQNPTDPEPRLRLANYLYDQRQWSRAAEWYRKALELDPKNVNARTDLGTALFYSGRPQEALREYQRSLEINPNHEPTLFNSIVVHLEGTRDLEAAERAWERLRKLNPGYRGLDEIRKSLDQARASSVAGVGR